jgi:hypothetical protein
LLIGKSLKTSKCAPKISTFLASQEIFSNGTSLPIPEKAEVAPFGRFKRFNKVLGAIGGFHPPICCFLTFQKKTFVFSWNRIDSELYATIIVV